MLNIPTKKTLYLLILGHSGFTLFIAFGSFTD